MKIAFVYAGQGSQKPGMGMDLYESSAVFKQAFDAADPTGKLKEMCFHGTMEELTDTRNTQPCMVAFGTAITAMLKAEGIVPEMAAGLSLGEYTALQAAGVWDAKTAVELVTVRGQAMATAVSDVDCKMVAILGLDRELLQQACTKGAEQGIVEIANYNCPGQIVIGGETKAVDIACELAKEMGAKRVMPLQVSCPFHTQLMVPASTTLAAKFKETAFGEMAFPVIFNVTGKPLAEGQTIQDLLERQVANSVYFEDSISYMADAGVDTIVEIGPGKALSGFIRKTAKEIKTYVVEDVKSFTETIEALKGGN